MELLRIPYIPQEEDEGDYLRVTATYEDELGAGKTAQKVSDSEVLDREPTNDYCTFHPLSPMTP